MQSSENNSLIDSSGKYIKEYIEKAQEIVNFFESHARGITPVMEKLHDLGSHLFSIEMHSRVLVKVANNQAEFCIDEHMKQRNEIDQLKERIKELEKAVESQAQHMPYKTVRISSTDNFDEPPSYRQNKFMRKHNENKP